MTPTTPLPPPLTASRPLLPAVLQLSLALLSLLLSLLLLLFESRLSPRIPRLLADGDITPTPTPPARAPRRARFCLTLLRLLLTVTVTVSLLLAAIPVFRLASAPPTAPLARAPAANLWPNALVSRALLAAAAAAPDLAPLAGNHTRVGLGPRAPSPVHPAPSPAHTRWAALLVLVAAAAILGAALAVPAQLVHLKRPVAWLVFVQAIVWLVAALVAALITPSALPYDAAPLEKHWMDRLYHSTPEFINETRFIANWFVAVPDPQNPDKEKISPLADYPDFQQAFCTQFTELMPRTGSEVLIEEENDDPESPPTSAPPTSIAPTEAQSDPTTTTTTTTTTAPPTTTVADEPPEEEPVEEEQPPPEDEQDQQPPPSTDAPPTQADRPTNPPSRRRVAAPLALRQQVEVEQSPGPDVPSPDSITIDPLPVDLAAEVLLVYLVGKPIGRDQYRILSYMALGSVVGAPVAIAQMFRSWILSPFVVLWAGVWVLICLLATPSVLRVLTVPVDEAQIFSLCGINYRILVADDTTMLIARLDAAFFAVVLVIALAQGYRWLRLAERSADEDGDQEVKLVNYEEVYSGSGSLRW